MSRHVVMTENKSSFLVKAAFAPSTLSSYSSSLSQFLSWCRDQGKDPLSLEQLDLLFVAWLEHIYNTRGGKGKSIGLKALQGLHIALPKSVKSMPTTALALRGWSRLKPTKSHPPLTWDLACLIAVRLALTGQQAAAVGVLLAFERVGELVNLRKEDFADAKDVRVGSVQVRCSLRLAKTKTGPEQWAQIADPAVAGLVRELVKSVRPGKFIFPYSTTKFRSLFRAACKALGLNPHYVPHSLRHGAATRAYQLGVSLEDIMLAGRWKADKSARTYIQSGPALLLANRVSPLAAQLGSLFATNLEQTLSMALSQRH